MEIKKENGAVDIVKLIMALLVIVIHKPVFYNEFLNYISGNIICSVAVPFFFAASSYFFFRKINRDKNDNVKLLNFEKRLFKLYLIWTIIYLPCIFVKYNTGNYESLNLKLFLGQLLLTVKNFFLSTSFVHLWYVNALMLSVAIIFFLYKKLDYRAICILCVMAAIFSRSIVLFCPDDSFVSKVYGYFPEVIKKTLEEGLLFTSGGLLLSQIGAEKKKIGYGVSAAVISMILLVSFGALNFRAENKVIEILLQLLAFINASALLSVCLGIELKPSKAYGVIRKYSTLIYFSHLLMMSEVFRFLAFKTGITAFTNNNPLIYLITLTVSVIVSTLIIFLSKKEKLSFLKNLY